MVKEVKVTETIRKTTVKKKVNVPERRGLGQVVSGLLDGEGLRASTLLLVLALTLVLSTILLVIRHGGVRVHWVVNLLMVFNTMHEAFLFRCFSLESCLPEIKK